MKLALSLILSFVFLLWFVASVIGMVYVSRSAELSWLVPVILGQIFLVIGTAGLIAMLRAKKKGLWIDIVAILVGAIIVILPLIYHFGSEQTKTAITAHIPTLAGAGLFLFLRSGMTQYMFFQSAFAFFDYERSGISVFGENILIMIFWVFTGTHVALLCRNNNGKEEGKNNALISVIYVMAAVILGIVLHFAVP